MNQVSEFSMEFEFASLRLLNLARKKSDVDNEYCRKIVQLDGDNIVVKFCGIGMFPGVIEYSIGQSGFQLSGINNFNIFNHFELKETVTLNGTKVDFIVDGNVEYSYPERIEFCRQKYVFTTIPCQITL